MIDKIGLEQAIDLKPTTTVIVVNGQSYSGQLSLAKWTEPPPKNLTVQLKEMEYADKQQTIDKKHNHQLKTLVTILIGALIFVALIGYLNPQALTFIAPGGLLTTLVGIMLRGKKRKNSDIGDEHHAS